MCPWLQPFAFEHRFTAARDSRDNVAGAHGLFGRSGRRELSFDLGLHLADELIASLRSLAHNEDAFQITNGMHGEKLGLRLPSCTEYRAYGRIQSGENSCGKSCCCSRALLT